MITKTDLKKEAKGFTLIELLIVVALVGVVISVSTDIIISVLSTYSKSQIQNEIEQNANFVTQKMEKELRTALNVVDISPDTEEIYIRDSLNREISYVVRDGVITRTLDGESKIITNNDTLNGVHVDCNGSCFSLSNPSTETPTVVRISLKFSQNLTQDKKPFVADMVIDTSVVVRSSY